VGNQLTYPADATALVPSNRYLVRVTAGGQSPQESWFEVVAPTRAEALRGDLIALDQSLEAGTPDTTRVLLTAGLLAGNGLMHDARRRVLDALSSSPDEPALYQILGTIYERTGLRQQATTAFQEAQLLLDGGRPTPSR
jgi:predicted Zn-dependent protease